MRITGKQSIPNCVSYVCGANLAVSSVAVGCQKTQLLALREDSLNLADWSTSIKEAHVFVVTIAEEETLKYVTWLHDISYAWSISSTGILENAAVYDIRYANAKARILYSIVRDDNQS